MVDLSFFAWPAFVIVSWLLAYVFLFRPMIKRIRAVTGAAAILATPNVPKKTKFIVWLDSMKTVIASFFTAMFSLGCATMNVLSNNTDLLDNLKTEIPWATIITPINGLRIVALFTLVITTLHLYGKLTAAKAVPLVS